MRARCLIKCLRRGSVCESCCCSVCESCCGCDVMLCSCWLGLQSVDAGCKWLQCVKLWLKCRFSVFSVVWLQNVRMQCGIEYGCTPHCSPQHSSCSVFAASSVVKVVEFRGALRQAALWQRLLSAVVCSAIAGHLCDAVL